MPVLSLFSFSRDSVASSTKIPELELGSDLAARSAIDRVST